MVACTKSSYKIRNWKDYNESLVRRGDITFWFDDDVIDAWDHTNDEPKIGRPFTYSDTAIECLLMLRSFKDDVLVLGPPRLWDKEPPQDRPEASAPWPVLESTSAPLEESFQSPDMGSAHAVTIGNVPSLERFRRHPNWKSRLAPLE